MRGYHKTICLAFESEAYYQECMSNREKFKFHLNNEFEKHPELFPKDFKQCGKLNGLTPVSKKKD